MPWDMLREIAPTDKAYGRFISELIRREYVRKQDWQRLRDMQQPAMIDVGGLEDDEAPDATRPRRGARAHALDRGKRSITSTER